MAMRWRRLALAALAGTLALALGLAAGGGAAGAQGTPAELVGVWSLVTLQAAGQPAENTTGARMSLTFEADGRVSGQGGCNGFGGMATTDDRGRLQFGNFAATLRACADDSATAREGRYFATLQEARGYTLDGAGTLRLGFDQPGRQLVFQRAVAVPALPNTGAGGMAGATPGAGLVLAGGLLALLVGAPAGWRRARVRG